MYVNETLKFIVKKKRRQDTLFVSPLLFYY